MNGDNAAALDFLKKVYPEGPWVLTAINPNKKGIDTRTCHTEQECLQFLTEYNGKWNLYWSVNPVLRDVAKKAAKTDIKEYAYPHVDIDPRAGEDLAQDRERILGQLTTNLPKGAPPPSFIIDSGGGYWGFWKLEQPIPINGDLGRAEGGRTLQPAARALVWRRQLPQR
jgi:hypothetical protein